MKNISN